MKGIVLNQALVVVVVFVLCGCGLGKKCTNSGSPLSSHTLRYELLFSKNESRKAEALAHYANLIRTDGSGWLTSLPRKALREEDEFSRAMKYQTMKSYDGSNSYFLKEFSLHDVRLGSDSLHWRAQQTNLEYLLMLDADRLVWSFRRTAGLPTPCSPYGGWESPDGELRGHFVGHYLSASAQMWASTHNESLKEKMSAVVSALGECQEKMGTGYLSAFPSELFDRFEALEEVWAPYYTIHKLLAGLLDQYTLGGNAQALKMVTWMVEYFYNRVQNVISSYSIERHWLSLNEETGGMNDFLYNLYRITGDQKHFVLAHLFDKPCFLGLLAMQADDISGFHANTHIPIVVGAQMRYEITGDPLYKTIGAFFIDTVNSSHSYATGGTSVDEFWSDPKRMATTLKTENAESCTTYNMLKVSRNLFRWTKEVAYADYYERALTNGVLSIQRGTDPGVMIYMLPLGHGNSKARSYHGWGTKFHSFWCCYGTGIESFSKLGDSIYFEEEGEVPGLYIIQYISSSLDWKSGQMVLNQKVDTVVSWDPYLRITLTFSPKKMQGAGQSSAINLRIPVWAYSSGAKAAINAQALPVPAPNSFLSFTRKWSPDDKLTLQLPIALRTEAIKDDRPKYACLQAILYGPYLLVGLTNNDWDIQTDLAASLSDWITPIPAFYNSHLILLSQESGNSSFAFTNSNQSLTMERYPEPGTDASLNATFRLILEDSTSSKISSPKDAIGKFIMLEPINFPGMAVVQQGTNESLGITNSASVVGSSLFHLVAGLDGKDGTVSLESKTQKGCFVYSGVNYDSGSAIKLKCKLASSDVVFNQATSFTLKHGISEYHPISFVAKGLRRNYLLAPLLSLRDESYTVYFNIQASNGLRSAA
ncbi:hypothetical protein PVL29_007161 [Vitis rotundifolia]|uniref:Uncharacterized protein n=1 Tax=Vitis rotundifolia TaxID=103349 RepID=A0AA39A117_VITRO|nr:hypothetical protein PVL29_007161 [Vitis rotundifolia]